MPYKSTEKQRQWYQANRARVIARVVAYKSAKARARHDQIIAAIPAILGEQWLPVVGYESLYEISDHGRLQRACGGGSTFAGRLVKLTTTRGGYICADLCRGGVKQQHRINRLVLNAFCGLPPTPMHQSNHIDGRKANNTLPNLEWCTPKENVAHAIATGLRPSRRLVR